MIYVQDDESVVLCQESVDVVDDRLHALSLHPDPTLYHSFGRGVMTSRVGAPRDDRTDVKVSYPDCI